jgi:hypothetical protein
MRPTLVFAAVALLFFSQPAKAFHHHHHVWHGGGFAPSMVPAFVSPGAAFFPSVAPSFVSAPSAAFVPSMAPAFVSSPTAAFVPTASLAFVPSQTSGAMAAATQASPALSLGDVQTILTIVERLANLRRPPSSDSGQFTALSERVGRVEGRLTAVEARLTAIEVRLGMTTTLTHPGIGDPTIPPLPPGDVIPFPPATSPAMIASPFVEASLDQMEARYVIRRHFSDRLTEAQKKQLEADYKYLVERGRKDRLTPPPKDK